MSENPKILLSAWLEILSATHEPKLFRDAQAVFNRLYRRSANHEQGEFHQLLAKNHMEAMA